MASESSQKATSGRRSPRLLDRERSALLVVDVQQSLTPRIVGHTRLVWNAGRLIRAAREMAIPVEATEQYPQGLKATVTELAELLPPRHAKMAFSAAAVRPVVEDLAHRQRDQIVLCGIETHICILQSAMDLASEGFDMFVVADAVGSRSIDEHRLAIERMRDEGMSILSTEGVLFEWCATAEHPAFQTIRALVQEPPPEQ